MGLGERIKQAADHVGGLDKLAPQLSDVSRRTLSDWANDKTEPRASSIQEIAKITGVSMEWLITGREGQYIKLPTGAGKTKYASMFMSQLIDKNQEISRDDRKIIVHLPTRDLAVEFEALLRTHQKASQILPYSNLHTDDTTHDFIALPLFNDIQASAGHGAAPLSEQVDSVVSFTSRFLLDKGATPEKCVVIWASGDSMIPTIPDGSLLVVDQSQQEAKNGHIMVIGVDEDLLVKRIRRRLDGQIELISDNQAYAPEIIGPSSLKALRVIGRVVYFCRTP